MFFRAALIESWGRGIERIIEACATAGMPEPEWRLERTGVWAIFNFDEDKRRKTAQETGDTTQETGETTQEKILNLLRAEPSMTRGELAAQIGITPDGVKYHLEKLRSAGVIRRVDSTKAGRWEVLR